MESNKDLRPLFHITGGEGWINDPNGLIYFNRKYHVFYQYYPHATHWGPMHWGHVSSKDLLHWERMPIALYPKIDTNEDGCFSGTAIIHDNILFVVYTGFYENGGGENIRQLQCLASSTDGIYFQKHGVIIGEKELPVQYSACDFRDPKIWKENDTFYIIVAARKKEGRGHILLFKSSDIFNWEYVGDILDDESLGIMIECPDYVKDLNLLLHSEQFQPNEGNYHLNIHSIRYRIGNIDVSEGKFMETNKGIVDYGFDFYAPQVFANENIMIGWLNMWDRNNPSEKYGFAGTLTIPRKIDVIDGRLYQKPIWDYKNSETKRIIKEYKGTLVYGAAKLTIKNLKDIILKLRKKGNQFFKVTLTDDELIFDRSRAGEQIIGAEKDNDSLNDIRRMPLLDRENVEIEIISDEFSLEFFVNGLAASFLLYPEVDSCGFAISVDAEECVLEKSKFE